MTDLFGSYRSQSTLALQRIDSSKYPDTNKDFEATVRRLTGFVDYISQYLQQMQKGVDQANEDPISRIRDTITNFGVLLGGGELLYGIDLGDLQYFLPALGAMFGFDSDQPFPVNLLYAAEHFLLGYIIPLDSWNFAVEDIIDGWMTALGLNDDFIAAVHLVLDNMGRFTGDLLTIFNDVTGLLGIFDIFDFVSGPIGPIWGDFSSALSGFNIATLGAITDPFLETLTPWLVALGNLIGLVDDFLEGFTGGIGGGDGSMANPFAWLTDLLNMFGGFVGLGTGSPSIFNINSIPILGPVITALTGSGSLDLSSLFNFGQLFSSLNFLSPTFDPVAAWGEIIELIFLPFNLLLGPNSLLSAFNLFGFIPPGLIPFLPVSHIGNDNPELLGEGSFGDPDAIAPGGTGWIPDDTTGHTANGSVKATANGQQRMLVSDAIYVGDTQQFALGMWIKWATASYTGTNHVTLAINRYTGPTHNDFIGTTDISSQTFTGANQSTWQNITGNYTVPPGVTYVRVALKVNPNVTAGNIWFDDISAKKTGDIAPDWVNGLTNFIGNLTNTFQSIIGGNIIGGIVDFWAGVANALLGFGASAVPAYSPENAAVANTQSQINALNALINTGTDAGTDSFTTSPLNATDWVSIYNSVDIDPGGFVKPAHPGTAGAYYSIHRYDKTRPLTTLWQVNMSLIGLPTGGGGQFTLGRHRFGGGGNATLTNRIPGVEVDVTTSGIFIRLVSLFGSLNSYNLGDNGRAVYGSVDVTSYIKSTDILGLECDETNEIYNIYLNPGPGSSPLINLDDSTTGYMTRGAGFRDGWFQVNTLNDPFGVGNGWDNWSIFDRI